MKKLVCAKSFLGVTTALLLGASAFSPTCVLADDTPQAGGDLVMVRSAPIQSFMPTLVAENGSIWALEEVFDTLLLPTEDGKGVQPGLATEWKQSDDGLEWTFKLRSDVKFSDGTPMTSKDVKFSLDQASNEANPFGFINAAIAEVKTPDAETVVVRTKAPFAPLPSVMAIFSNSIVPDNYGGKSAEEFAKAPVGTGPFKLAERTIGVGARLVRNTEYWQKGKPYLDSISINEVADGNTRANQLMGGQAQINEFPAYSSTQALRAAGGDVTLGVFPSSRVDFLAFNTTKAPFDDAHVRRAIASLIDRQALIKVILFGNGEPAGAYMSPSSWSHNADIKGLPFDLDAAKKELAQSNVPDGFSATISVESGDSDQATMAQIILAQAAKIGIKLAIQVLDPAALDEARQAANFDMAFTYNTTDIVDPDEIIRFAGVYDGGSHVQYSFYNNKEIAEKAEQAATLGEQDARKKLYDEIQALWDKDQPMVPLYYSPEIYSFSTNVHGFHPYVTGNYNLSNVWLSH
ncbi:ABC transporter substrate-binding protein [Pseudaminobacter soli (ex Li et al. 2025)]|nr:ABC transporter substrate-binding protein [Mesorhizobium soli]